MFSRAETAPVLFYRGYGTGSSTNQAAAHASDGRSRGVMVDSHKSNNSQRESGGEGKGTPCGHPVCQLRQSSKQSTKDFSFPSFSLEPPEPSPLAQQETRRFLGKRMFWRHRASLSRMKQAPVASRLPRTLDRVSGEGSAHSCFLEPSGFTASRTLVVSEGSRVTVGCKLKLPHHDLPPGFSLRELLTPFYGIVLSSMRGLWDRPVRVKQTPSQRECKCT